MAVDLEQQLRAARAESQAAMLLLSGIAMGLRTLGEPYTRILDQAFELALQTATIGHMDQGHLSAQVDTAVLIEAIESMRQSVYVGATSRPKPDPAR